MEKFVQSVRGYSAEWVKELCQRYYPSKQIKTIKPFYSHFSVSALQTKKAVNDLLQAGSSDKVFFAFLNTAYVAGESPAACQVKWKKAGFDDGRQEAITLDQTYNTGGDIEVPSLSQYPMFFEQLEDLTGWDGSDLVIDYVLTGFEIIFN